MNEQDIGWTRQRTDRGPTPARRRVDGMDEGAEEGERTRQGQWTEQRSGDAAVSGGEATPAGDPGPGGPRPARLP
eukprot:4746411-Lingulodinium_polyedra.AAC.1